LQFFSKTKRGRIYNKLIGELIDDDV
jgi:hypothetical protein